MARPEFLETLQIEDTLTTGMIKTDRNTYKVSGQIRQTVRQTQKTKLGLRTQMIEHQSSFSSSSSQPSQQSTLKGLQNLKVTQERSGTFPSRAIVMTIALGPKHL